MRASGNAAAIRGRRGSVSAADFTPAWWLANAHAQTLWASLCRSAPRPALARQRLELADGDFLDLDWSNAASPDAPIVLALHGLDGSARSAYVRGLVQRLTVADLQVVVMHFRGCSGEPNRLARSYHSGDTADLDAVVSWLRATWPERPLAAVGYSLGGNVLLKWLGEARGRRPIDCAVTVCVPLELAECADRLERGLSRLYARWLLRGLTTKVRRKSRRRPLPVDTARVAASRTMREFDDRATAPLHGFAGAEDYYRRSSSRQYLGAIATPTLVLQAADDPFMTDRVLPSAAELGPAVTVEVAARGGHVGFVAGSGTFGLRPRYWLEARVERFLRARLSSC